jgi:hypothetical protein
VNQFIDGKRHDSFQVENRNPLDLSKGMGNCGVNKTSGTYECELDNGKNIEIARADINGARYGEGGLKWQCLSNSTGEGCQSNAPRCITSGDGICTFDVHFTSKKKARKAEEMRSFGRVGGLAVYPARRWLDLFGYMAGYEKGKIHELTGYKARFYVWLSNILSVGTVAFTIGTAYSVPNMLKRNRTIRDGWGTKSTFATWGGTFALDALITFLCTLYQFHNNPELTAGDAVGSVAKMSTGWMSAIGFTEIIANLGFVWHDKKFPAQQSGDVRVVQNKKEWGLAQWMTYVDGLENLAKSEETKVRLAAEQGNKNQRNKINLEQEVGAWKKAQEFAKIVQSYETNVMEMNEKLAEKENILQRFQVLLEKNIETKKKWDELSVLWQVRKWRGWLAKSDTEDTEGTPSTTEKATPQDLLNLYSKAFERWHKEYGENVLNMKSVILNDEKILQQVQQVQQVPAELAVAEAKTLLELAQQDLENTKHDKGPEKTAMWLEHTVSVDRMVDTIVPVVRRKKLTDENNKALLDLVKTAYVYEEWATKRAEIHTTKAEIMRTRAEAAKSTGQEKVAKTLWSVRNLELKIAEIYQEAVKRELEVRQKLGIEDT